MATTIGYLSDGTPCDYTTGALFSAAFGIDPNLPASWTEDISIEVYYSDAIQGTFFDEDLTIPAIVDNNFMIKFEGMVGEYYNFNNPTFRSLYSRASTSQYIAGYFFNISFDARAIKGTGTADAILILTSRSMIVHISNTFIASDYRIAVTYYLALYIYNGILTAPYLNIAGYSSTYLYNTLAIIPTVSNVTDGGLHLYNSTLYAKTSTFSAAESLFMRDSIVYCSEISDTGTAPRSGSNIVNSCIFQSLYPGKYVREQTALDVFGLRLDIDFVNNILEDPKFKNTSGTFGEVADFELQDDSPCRYDNIPELDNPVYPTKRLERTTMGAWTYFSPVPDSDVLTSAGGTYDDANLIPANVKDTVTFGLAQTGTYDNATNPDYVISSQGGNWIDSNLIPGVIKSLIAYGVALTGTRTDAPVGDVTLGATYGADGTELTGTLVIDEPDPADVLSTATTGGVPGLWQKATDTFYKLGESFGINGTSEDGTFDPIVMPGTPDLNSLTPGDGTLTAAITTVALTDIVYLRYKLATDTAWTVWGTTRIGSGDLAVTGLTNLFEYNVEVYADNGGVASVYSDMLKGTPADPDEYRPDKYFGRNYSKLGR